MALGFFDIDPTFFGPEIDRDTTPFLLLEFTSPAAPVSIGSIDHLVVSDEGGIVVTATGTFPANDPLEVFVGILGNSTDTPCYGGQGYGFYPQSSDGTTLSWVMPPLAKGSAYVVTVRYQDVNHTFEFMTVLERNWKGKVFSIRSSLPPWYEIGNRRLDTEGRV